MGVHAEQPTVRVPPVELRSVAVAPTATSASLVASSPANALLQAASAGLILSGAIDDPGLFGSPDLSTGELVVAQFLIQGLYFSAFLLARSSRRSTLKAMDHLQRAIRLASKRAAQLEEARQDLDRALRVGDPGPLHRARRRRLRALRAAAPPRPRRRPQHRAVLARGVRGQLD